MLVPIVVGSLIGAFAITRLTDDAFERVFGLLMLPIIFLSIRKPKVRDDADPWPLWFTFCVFFAVGLYGGAVQAGVGLVLLGALTRAGYDLVTANNVKVVANLTLTSVVLPIFIAQGKVEWIPALILAVGLTAGGWIGAHAAVRGGERFIRAAMVVAAVLLSAQVARPVRVIAPERGADAHGSSGNRVRSSGPSSVTTSCCSSLTPSPPSRRPTNASTEITLPASITPS